MDSQQPPPIGFTNGQHGNHGVDLPYDILHIIFTVCWKEIESSEEEKLEENPRDEEGGEDLEEDNDSKDELEREYHFPTIASQVCRLWRHHALATPEFWAILKFQQRSLHAEKYQTRLARCKTCPLDIIIGPQPFVEAASRIKRAGEILRLTEPHLARWRSIRTYKLPNKVLRVIFNRISRDGLGRLEKLETVKVVQELDHLWVPGPANGEQWKFEPFSESGEAPPALRNLTLEGTSPLYFSGRFKLFQIWWIINQFHRDPSRELRNLHDFLSALPCLQALHVYDRRFSEPLISPRNTQSLLVSSSLPPLTHHSLTEISLFASQATSNTVLSSLILPNLVYPLDRRREEPPIGVCCLPHLAQNHPFSQIASLRLGGDTCALFNEDRSMNLSNLEHLEGALVGLPNIKILTFDHVDFEVPGGRESHLRCLGRVCPLLRRLVFILCEGYTLGDLLSIIEKRKNSKGWESLVNIVLASSMIPGTWEEVGRIKTGFEHFNTGEYTTSELSRLLQPWWKESIE
ncbi:hypothetical protein FRC01_004943 [Tulasnella sp. 417]|nr:hypothetical protein FRC01_004943 [Tulasnella sp. 417]